MVDFTFHFWNQNFKRNLSLNGKSNLELCRWEESVEIEWQCVELFVPVVAFERPELDPPRHATVLLRCLDIQRVVEEHSNDQRDGGRRHEYGVEERVELHSRICHRSEK